MKGQNDKIRWLGNQLNRWISENLIDENTADKIRQLYPQTKTSRSWAMIVFSGIGACIIGLGVILLFAYNWADMDKFTKLTIIFGSIAISHSLGITIFLCSERFKALGEALTIVGTMFFGSGIWLIAQIYHIEEHFPNAFLLWGIGAALLAWTMPSIAQAIIAAILFTLWAIMEGIAFGTSIPYIFGLLLLLFPLAYIKRNGLLICVLLLALGLSTLFVVAANSNEIVFYSLLSLFTLYTAIGIIHQKFRKLENFGQIYRFLGLAGYFLTLFILCFTEVAEDVIEDIELFSSFDTILYWAIPFVLALAGWGIIGRDIISKVKLKYFSYDLILMPLLLIFFCCYSLLSTRGELSWLAIAVFNLMFLSHILMMMASGCKETNAAGTILGSVGLAALTVARFTDLFDSLAVRGLIFVIVGILIFTQGFFYVSSKKEKSLAGKHMRKLLIICAIVFQIFLLAFMAGQREYVLHKGKPVYLRTVPIDPRDYFRGDYVRLTYEISNVESYKLRDGLKLLEKDRRARDKKIYVVLQIDDENVANILYASDKKPKKGQLFIRGRLDRKRNYGINVRYGIEAYFMGQGKGKELEKRKIKDHRASLEMQIALGTGGIAVINGHRWAPISIEIADLQLKDNLPQSAKLTLTNISENPVAIVDLSSNRSLKIEKDLRRWWWNENENWRWINEDASASSPENENVHVLEPDQSYELVVDFNNPYWSISLNNKDAILVSGYGFRNSPFRIVYEPPSAQQCEGLKDADLIWHGRISSESIPNRD